MHKTSHWFFTQITITSFIVYWDSLPFYGIEKVMLFWSFQNVNFMDNDILFIDFGLPAYLSLPEKMFPTSFCLPCWLLKMRSHKRSKLSPIEIQSSHTSMTIFEVPFEINKIGTKYKCSIKLNKYLRVTSPDSTAYT